MARPTPKGGLNRDGLRSGGRRPGTPNRTSVEARQLCSELVTDVDYQQRLRRDFRNRRLHPTIESLVWAYHAGKPVQPVLMHGTLDTTSRLVEERNAFAQLDVADLEQLAAESQALVNRALTLARLAGNVTEDGPPTPAMQETESPTTLGESDNGSSVNLHSESADDDNPSTE
jgi:hypothetical protein